MLVVIDRHDEVAYSNAAINAVNAARACYGFDCPRIVVLDPPSSWFPNTRQRGGQRGELTISPISSTGFARYLSEADAIAVSSVITVPPEFHQDYFDSAGGMVNPWGGVEAIFTHALRSCWANHRPTRR